MTRARSFMLGGAVGILSSLVGIAVAVRISTSIDEATIPPARATVDVRTEFRTGPPSRNDDRTDRAAPTMPARGPERETTSLTPTAPDSPVAPPLVAASSAIARIASAKRDPSDAATRTLIDALDSDDPIAVAEAADGLVARKAKAGAMALSKIDIRRSGGIAPSVTDSRR